jgi:hypothetical protein
LQSALAQGPGSTTAQQLQERVFGKYIALARGAQSAGDADLANLYADRAQAVLYGSWIKAGENKPAFC